MGESWFLNLFGILICFSGFGTLEGKGQSATFRKRAKIWKINNDCMVFVFLPWEASNPKSHRQKCTYFPVPEFLHLFSDFCGRESRRCWGFLPICLELSRILLCALSSLCCWDLYFFKLFGGKFCKKFQIWSFEFCSDLNRSFRSILGKFIGRIIFFCYFSCRFLLPYGIFTIFQPFTEYFEKVQSFIMIFLFHHRFISCPLPPWKKNLGKWPKCQLLWKKCWFWRDFLKLC